ncbi:hypothetical protein OG812_02155 [Streptomyces sp. NBC_00566]|nr:hypothetical protein [Streptomyces sp. NBC_00566]WUB85467.1 hypothetical protein OG812_02155 [Streptomyces sp. NBC_00566]
MPADLTGVFGEGHYGAAVNASWWRTADRTKTRLPSARTAPRRHLPSTAKAVRRGCGGFRLVLGGVVDAALFALYGPVRGCCGYRAGLECGEPGETGGGEYRGVDTGKYVAQSALARSLEPAGKGVEGAAQPGQDILVAAAYPLGNGG